jgi:hypothetical protein
MLFLVLFLVLLVMRKVGVLVGLAYVMEIREKCLLAVRPENPSAENREPPMYATKGSLDVKRRGMSLFVLCFSQSRFFLLMYEKLSVMC